MSFNSTSQDERTMHEARKEAKENGSVDGAHGREVDEVDRACRVLGYCADDFDTNQRLALVYSYRWAYNDAARKAGRETLTDY